MELKKLARPIMLSIGFAILVWLILKVGIGTIWDMLLNLNYWYVLLSIFIMYFVLVFFALRLKHMIRSELNFFEILRIYFCGSVFNVAGFIQGTGEAVKMGVFKKKNIPLTKSGAAMSSEVFFNLFVNGVLFLFFLIYIFQDFYSKMSEKLNMNILWIIPVVAMTVLIVAYFMRNNKHVQSYIFDVIQNLTFKNFLINSSLTLIGWAFSWLSTYYMFKAAGITLGMPIIIFSSCASHILGVASLIPSGLGIRETVRTFTLTLANISVEAAGSVTIINRILGFFSIFIMWIVLEWHKNIRGIFSGKIKNKVETHG